MEYINWVRDEQGGREGGRWFYLISFREGYIYTVSPSETSGKTNDDLAEFTRDASETGWSRGTQKYTTTLNQYIIQIVKHRRGADKLSPTFYGSIPLNNGIPMRTADADSLIRAEIRPAPLGGPLFIWR